MAKGFADGEFVRSLSSALGPDEAAVLARRVVTAMVGFVAALATLLIVRRVAGAMEGPLPWGHTLGLAGVCGALSTVVRIVVAAEPSSRMALGLSRATFASMAVLAAATALPSLGLANAVIWAALGSTIGYAEFRRRSRPTPRSAAAPFAASSPPTPPASEKSWQDSSAPLASEFEEEFFLQELFRRRDAEGVESVHGRLRAEFVAGQRHATLHAGFCPPLDGPPEVEAELADGPEGTVRVVQALAHGVRLEVRLAEPAEEACEAAVDLSARPRSAARRG